MISKDLKDKRLGHTNKLVQVRIERSLVSVQNNKREDFPVLIRAPPQVPIVSR